LPLGQYIAAAKYAIQVAGKRSMRMLDECDILDNFNKRRHQPHGRAKRYYR
jgi:hypothetical protein